MTKIHLNIEADNAADLVVQLQQLLQSHQSAPASAAPQPAPPPYIAPIPSRDEPLAEIEMTTAEATNGSRSPAPATRAKPGPKPKATPAAESAKPAAKLDRGDVRRALTAHLSLHDEETTAALLKKHGHVDKVSALKEEHFQAVYDAATAE